MTLAFDQTAILSHSFVSPVSNAKGSACANASLGPVALIVRACDKPLYLGRHLAVLEDVAQVRIQLYI